MAIGTNPEMLAAGYYDTPSFLRTDYKNSIKEFKPIQFASGDKSMLSRIGNSKVTAPALMVTSSLTHLLPGSNRKMANPAVEAFLQGMEKTGEYAGYGSTASFVASAIPGVQPVTLPLSAGLATISALSTGAANVTRHFYGEEPIKVQVDENGNVVNTKPNSSLHGESGDGAVSIPTISSGNEMSYQDIFDNLAQNKINYETPVSSDVLNKAIRNNVFSSIGEMMSQNTSGGIRGDVVFNDSYNKQLNAMLNIRNTLNNADVGSDQYRLAGIASNAMMYEQETLTGIDSNFNKDLARVNSIMKTYSTQKDNSALIQKYDTELKKTMEKQAAAIAKVESDISDNAEKADGKKIFKYSEQEKQKMLLNAGASFDPVIADYKNAIARAIAESNTDRRVGSSTTISAKGKAIVDMWNSLPNKGVDITDDHIEYIASKAGLGNAQKRAVEATILAEAGGKSDSINPDDKGAASIGIAQWRGSRADSLIKFAKENGANPKDAWTQAKYFVQDIKNPSSWNSTSAMKTFFTTSDQAVANKMITDHFEIPDEKLRAKRYAEMEYYQKAL